MTIREAIKGARGIFKPGYPTGRREYMILDSHRDSALEYLRELGFKATRCPCGHDYNYGGDLYYLNTDHGND